MTAYDQGDFKKAASLYEEILGQGVRNGSVYYNLGNSYFRLGEKGKAIASYLAARTLLPRDPDVRANLKFAHEQTVDKLTLHAPSSVFRDLSFWVDRTTPKELLYLSAILGSLGLCFLLLSLFIENLIFLRMWSLVFSALAFLGFASFAISFSFQENWGAVSVPLSEARSGPGSQNTVVFQLHEGAPFLVDSVEGDWYRIYLSDGKIAWISAKDVKVFLL